MTTIDHYIFVKMHQFTRAARTLVYIWIAFVGMKFHSRIIDRSRTAGGAFDGNPATQTQAAVSVPRGSIKPMMTRTIFRLFSNHTEHNLEINHQKNKCLIFFRMLMNRTEFRLVHNKKQIASTITRKPKARNYSFF